MWRGANLTNVNLAQIFDAVLTEKFAGQNAPRCRSILQKNSIRVLSVISYLLEN